MKKINYRHYICIGITALFVVMSVFVFPHAFGRFVESLKDVCNSVVYFFETLVFDESERSVTVTEFSQMPFELPLNLPNTWDEFKLRFSDYWSLWVSSDNFANYCDWLLNVFVVFAYVLLYSMPLLWFAVVYNMFFGNKTNNNYNKDSKPLTFWKKLCATVFAPVKAWMLEFVNFIKAHGYYWKIWLVIWLYNFNAFAIFMDFIAFYLYFVASFDFIGIYKQVLKLLIDLSVVINFVPIVFWCVIAFWILDKVRRNVGYKRLNHFERRNRGFINERPILTLVCGTMGKKKTTMITDMALSQEIMFRDKAFELLLKADLKFPYFPWINFENSLKKAIEKHSVYNLATCKRFVNGKKRKYLRNKCKKRPLEYNYFFGYDYLRYGVVYDNGLETVDIWNVLSDYAQLYFIYVMECSLIISNYSIRTDNVLEDLGNFPRWNTELFKRDSRMMQAYSRHSHILDFDALRLGKKVVENNAFANVFEFGVVLVTEIGKERGNTLELKEKKKDAKETNQKNDLFNSWLKLCRHSATVDSFPFVKIISDEQRPSSWGADAVELCEIIYIKESGEQRLAMPFFNLGGLVFDWEVDFFQKRYSDYRFRRGDNCLSMHLFKALSAKINDYRTKIYNTFGYCTLQIQVESGTRDGILTNKQYYLMYKKIYSRRFATDCYSDFYAKKALDSLVGLEDLPEYSSVKATVQEFLRQNSYFMAELLVGLLKNTTE